MMKRYLWAGILAGGLLSGLAGCGSEATEDNPVDKDVPKTDIKQGEAVDPDSLFGDEETEKGSSESDSSEASKEQGNSSEGDELKTPDLSEPASSGPKLEPPKLKKPGDESL